MVSMKLLATLALGAYAQTEAPSEAPAEVTEVTEAPVPEELQEGEPELAVGGKAVRILGQSGKFRFFRESEGPNDPERVTIELDYLRELDAEGNQIGNSGPASRRHSVNTFASQEFTFSDLETVQIGVNQTVTAQKLSFQSTVGDETRVIRLDTYLFQTGGLIGPEGEEWTVRAGDMKFNIAFPTWPFCGVADCGGDEGTHIEVGIKIKGSKQEIDPAQDTFDLGGGISLGLTNKVMLDDVQGMMPEGYPMLTMQGQSQIFKFRFPAFTTSAEYDPVLQEDAGMGDFDGATISGVERHAPSFFFLSSLFALLFAK
jgi:hypothetical protein